MAPGLLRDLRPNGLREARRPLESRQLGHDLSDYRLGDEMRLVAHVIWSVVPNQSARPITSVRPPPPLRRSSRPTTVRTEFRGDLHQLAHARDRARRARILMADDGLGDALGLGARRAERLELLQSQEAAVELERQVRVVAVLRRRRQVVEETGQRPGFEEAVPGGGDPGLEVRRHHVMAVAEDAEAVVVGLLRQGVVDVFLCFADDVGRGPDRFEGGW